MEVALADNRGNRVSMHIETWKELMENRVELQRLLHGDKSFAPIWIQDVTVEYCKMKDFKIVKFAKYASHTNISKTCIYLKPATVEKLFNYEDCINHMYTYLSKHIYHVNINFENFVKLLREKNITEMSEAAKAIHESHHFDCESLIDCELLACALKTIMYTAENK